MPGVCVRRRVVGTVQQTDEADSNHRAFTLDGGRVEEFVDVLLIHEPDQKALALECKWQAGGGTTDEKIPYALQDIAAMWIPGCLAYGGNGWSKGVLATLEGSRFAVACEPPEDLARTKRTLELDHVIGAVFGYWDLVLPSERLFRKPSQLLLPGLKPTRPREPDEAKRAG